MSTVSTYIFVHSQQIILDCDANGKFKELPLMKYVFLGAGDIDKIAGREDVIIARNSMNNIEQYPKFCSFTGWYMLWKNNLIKTEYVHLFEYDVKINPEFHTATTQAIKDGCDMIGYVPVSMTFCFINMPEYLANLLPILKKTYNVDGEQMVKKALSENKHAQWSSTSNTTFSLSTFNQYMEWFDKLIIDLTGNPMCGHAHERSITFFYLIFKKRILLMHNVLKHLMHNSHGTTF